MIRVLVVLPFYGGSLPVGRYCAEALREIGCLVEVFEAPSFFPAYQAFKELKVSLDRLDSLTHSFLQLVSQSILAKAERFSPDLVLCLAQAPLNRLALKKLRARNIPTAMWFVEDFRFKTYWRAFAPEYSIFAVIQKEPFSSELSQAGVENSLYLPLAAQPTIHQPVSLSENEKKEYGSDISFMGAGYPNRRIAFARMIKEHPDIAAGLKIWGTEWDGEPVLAPYLQRQGQRISPEDCVRIFNASAINLNLHSTIKADTLVSHGDFVNPRTFEVAACGAFQLVDERTLLPELFAPDEMASFDSFEGMLGSIRHYSARPQEREAMALRAQERVLAEHNYAARMRQLLDFAAERIPGFGAHKGVDWPESMPDDMRQTMDTLLEDLGLPANAGFDDVITAVRSKSEKLSDAEAALLFLDEWKKLYGK